MSIKEKLEKLSNKWTTKYRITEIISVSIDSNCSIFFTPSVGFTYIDNYSGHFELHELNEERLIIAISHLSSLEERIKDFIESKNKRLASAEKMIDDLLSE